MKFHESLDRLPVRAELEVTHRQLRTDAFLHGEVNVHA